MMSHLVSRMCWQAVIARQTRPATDLESFPALAPEEQQRIMAERLLSQIRYFGARADALPEWRDAAAVGDASELWRHWSSLPVVTKQTLQSRFNPQEIAKRFHVVGRPNATGGSTGEPTQLLLDAAAIQCGAAAQIYAQRKMGWEPGMPLIRVWGSERDIGKAMRRRARTVNRLLHQWIVDGFEIHDRTVDRVIDLIRRHRPVALSGYSSMLEYLARRVVERGIPIPEGSVRAAWNGGEMLLPSQVTLFQEAFGVPILNCYGGRELSVMAFQPVGEQALRVVRPWLFVEVVDESGRPVQPGETGRLLWTSTVCRGTPLLRYDIGDFAVFDAEHASAAGVTQLRELQGRTSGLLRLADGRVINNIFWNHLFKDFSAIRQFQIAIRETGLAVRLVGRGLSEEDDRRMRGTLRSFLLDQPFEISWVDRIPLTAQGKLVQVVREQ